MSEYDEQHRAFHHFLSIPSSEAYQMGRSTGAVAPAYTHWARDDSLPDGACSLTTETGKTIIFEPGEWQSRPDELRDEVRRWILENVDLRGCPGLSGGRRTRPDPYWVEQWKKANPYGVARRRKVKPARTAAAKTVPVLSSGDVVDPSSEYQQILNSAGTPLMFDSRPLLEVKARIVWETDGEETLDVFASKLSMDGEIYVVVPDDRCPGIGVWLAPDDVWWDRKSS